MVKEYVEARKEIRQGKKLGQRAAGVMVGYNSSAATVKSEI